MAGQGLERQLRQLHDLILRERECAKALDMDALLAVTREKEELLLQLEAVDAAPLALRPLAEEIKRENRRNAYLFWSTLRYIRDSVTFLTRQTAPAAYGAAGRMVHSCNSGMLLTGRI